MVSYVPLVASLRDSDTSPPSRARLPEQRGDKIHLLPFVIVVSIERGLREVVISPRIRGSAVRQNPNSKDALDRSVSELEPIASVRH